MTREARLGTTTDQPKRSDPVTPEDVHDVAPRRAGVQTAFGVAAVRTGDDVDRPGPDVEELREPGAGGRAAVDGGLGVAALRTAWSEAGSPGALR